MLVPGPLLLVSGTASIVGHASMHCGDTAAQLRETLANLDVLLQPAHASGASLSARFNAGSLLKVYLRHGGDAAIVDRCLRDHFGDDVAILAVYSHLVDAGLYLPDYPMGHLIAFQVEQHFAKQEGPIGPEFERICRIGSLTPDVWMRQAVGAPLSAEPLLAATARALDTPAR